MTATSAFVRRAALVVAAFVAVVAGFAAPAEADAPAKINGSGSSYVALAMQQWVADGQSNGLQVNYLPTGSPDGLQQYLQSLVDFAGTEAEFSSLGVGTDGSRGYQYVPDVAGAVAVMYNVDDRAGRKVNYLHLARRTIARIFLGDITTWADPAITADNKGLILPDQPISVVFRSGQSGTTALFYDFVAHAAPDVFGPWAARNGIQTDRRIISLPQGWAPKVQGFTSSDQIAQGIANDSSGKWSIGYDEFGFAKTYHVNTAWVQNEAGKWVQPYANNISAALESATLRDDFSQELSGVYTSRNPLTYPISAYSYMVTQCSGGGRSSCAQPYTNKGVIETLSKWMRYIACDGQVNMARIGYSPLPKNLSQEMANSIGRLNNAPPETLTAANCANPRFTDSFGAGAFSPPDPYEKIDSLAGNGGGGGGSGSAGGGSSGGSAAGGGAKAGGSSAAGGAGAAGAGSTSGGNAATATGSTKTAGGAAGVAGAAGASGAESAGAAADPTAGPDAAAGADASVDAVRAAGGGSSNWRNPAPVAYLRPPASEASMWPLLLLLALVIVPPTAYGAIRARRRET